MIKAKALDLNELGRIEIIVKKPLFTKMKYYKNYLNYKFRNCDDLYIYQDGKGTLILSVKARKEI